MTVIIRFVILDFLEQHYMITNEIAQTEAYQTKSTSIVIRQLNFEN